MLSLAAFGVYIIIQFFVQNLSQFTTKFTAAFGQCASHSSYFHKQNADRYFRLLHFTVCVGNLVFEQSYEI